MLLYINSILKLGRFLAHFAETSCFVMKLDILHPHFQKKNSKTYLLVAQASFCFCITLHIYLCVSFLIAYFFILLSKNQVEGFVFVYRLAS